MIALPRLTEALPPVAVPFRDLAPDRCRAFLPGQEGPEGLCCGKRAMGGDRLLAESYCATHRAGFVIKPRRR
jgi:hypothetical protein